MGRVKSQKRTGRKPLLIIFGVLCIMFIATTVYYIPLTNSLSAQLDASNAEVGQLKKTVNDITTENEQLKAILSAKENEISILNGAIVNLNNSKNNLESNITSLNSQITDLNNRVTSLSKAVSEQKLKIENQSSQISSLQAELTAVRNAENTTTANEINFCFHLQDFNNNTIPLMQELRVKWVRLDWMTDYNMTNYLSKFAENNIKVLCIIDNWSVGNFNASTWNDSVIKIINSEGASYVSAWEIWNEPNRDMSSNDYYQALKSAYTIIKNYNNSQIVISAGLAPIGDYLEYYRELYNNSDFKQYIDYQGVHNYYDSAPENLAELNNITAITGNEKTWITETGIYSTLPYNETYQADYVMANWDLLHARVDKIFWYEFKDYQGISPEQENNFGALTINDTKKPAFYAIEGISIG